ncbi:hypothetical protein [Litorimonas cladophorae]|nr:hypothetical protein [Litorimonas cladophorae]
MTSTAVWFGLLLFGAVGCKVETETSSDVLSEVPAIEVVDPTPNVVDASWVTSHKTPKIIGTGEPLNCPQMLSAQSFHDRWRERQVLRFWIGENTGFDPNKEDVCEGDLKNIWSDLGRFNDAIETHMPHIKGVSYSLRDFPETDRALRIFIDEAATASSLHQKLDVMDRSTLEGGMNIDHTILRFIFEQQEAYFEQEHMPIIRAAMPGYDLGLKYYDAEKLGYCYHPYEICRGYFGPNFKRTESAFKLERLGAPLDSIGFIVP